MALDKMECRAIFSGVGVGDSELAVSKPVGQVGLLSGEAGLVYGPLLGMFGAVLFPGSLPLSEQVFR